MESDLRTTLVFVKQEGHWQLANVQFSPVMGRP
jgi:hypothetical protein